jgi:hypothetical protein
MKLLTGSANYRGLVYSLPAGENCQDERGINQIINKEPVAMSEK